MKIKLVLIALLVICITACDNQEFIVRDFDTQSVFFPNQRPARTLVLGNYDLGFNDNDNNERFEVRVSMSGVSKNTEDRRVFFELAPDLIDPTQLGVNDVNVKILPSTHYRIEQESPLTIPAGSISGSILVQLTQDFFNDPLSVGPKNTTNYVLPLRITNFENLDSLLTGVPAVQNPLKIVDEDWSVTPKDYTLYGIKYMNEYQGIYLRRGAISSTGTIVVDTLSTNTSRTFNFNNEQTVYRSEFIINDELVDVYTTARNKDTLTNRVRRPVFVNPNNSGENIVFQDAMRNVSIEIEVNEDNTVVITQAPGETRTVTGTGEWRVNGDTWGGRDRDVLYLDYTYQDNEQITAPENVNNVDVMVRKTYNLTHRVLDTLVIRNRNVIFETFDLEITP